MAHTPRKSSACVTLVLVGAAALAGCGDAPGNRRASYATREACLADWGDPRDCEEQREGGVGGGGSGGSGGGTGGHLYYGPATGRWQRYESERSASARSSDASRSGASSSSSSSGSSSTSRGGFGSHGGSASS